MGNVFEPRANLHLLVVIPCVNEQETVARVIRGVPREIPNIAKIEVAVFDDGSTDETEQRARDAGAEVFSHPRNEGLGATFRDAVGIALSKNVDIMVHIDGDGQFDPADIPFLVEAVVDGRADMATASRFLKAELIPEMPLLKRWGNWGVSKIVWLLTGKNFHDVSCGFRAFSAEALLRMNLFSSFTYTQESFLDLIFKNLKVVEVPVKVRGVREFGRSRMSSNIPRYFFRSLQTMLRAFISYRPFSLFFSVSCIFLAVGIGFLAFLGIHYYHTRSFSPHIWAGFVGGSFGFLGISTLMLGLIGDMLVRIRLNQENLLYQMKQAERRNTRNRD